MQRTITHQSRSREFDKIIERQLRNWEIARSQHRPAVSPPPGRSVDAVAEFVTITNNVGGGGGDIAHLLSERLGWPVFDRDILKEMAGNDDTRTRLYRSMDERDMSWTEETFRALMQEDFCKNDYFHRLIETLLCIARRGPAVFVGRSADLILSKQRGLRVKLFTSLDHRVRQFADRMQLDLNKARSEVERIDNERAAFIRKHFNRDVNDPTRFDLLINLERYAADQAVNLIVAAMRARGISVSVE
jgi:cytidylate kinase